MKQENSTSEIVDQFEINTGFLYAVEKSLKDDSVSNKVWELLDTIRHLLVCSGKYSEKFEMNGLHQSRVSRILADKKEQDAQEENTLYPYTDSFLSRATNYPKKFELEKGFSIKYALDIYSYTTEYFVHSDNRSLGIVHYVLLLSFKIRHLRHSQLNEFLEYQAERYWSLDFQKKLYLETLDHLDLIEESKLALIKEWVKNRQDFLESSESREESRNPDLTIRETCMLFFVLLKEAEAWPNEKNGVKQSKVINLIHSVTGYSKDRIKKKINKDEFILEDNDYEKSISKVKSLLSCLNSEKINKICEDEFN